jgi:predicted dehydrogenase
MQKAKAWLPEIGRVVQMIASIRSAGGAAHPKSALDEIVTDILPHPLSIMYEIGLQDLQTAEWLVVKPGDGELHAIAEVDGMTLSISASMNSRPTTNDFEIVGTKGTIRLDFFHGYAFREPGSVSKTRKILHPFDLASRRLLAASINLGRRALRREPAYPGLRRLTQLFYAAVLGEAELPISTKAAIDVAHARDAILYVAASKEMKE